MDPTSLTASIITLLHLTAQISGYVNSCKSAPREQARIAIEASNLYSLLTTLRFRVEEAQSDDPWFKELKLLNRDNGPLHLFKETLENLVNKIHHPTSSSKIKSILTWKFSKEDVNDLMHQIERLKSLINLALIKDQLCVTGLVEDVQAIRSTEEVRQLQDVKSWLHASDPSTNYDAARQRHLKGTGSWLLREPAIEAWKQSQSQLLWLRGFRKRSNHSQKVFTLTLLLAGCGKTILSSTIIENLTDSTQGVSQNTALAYFFFDFRDEEKQTTQNLIRSILVQLSEYGQESISILQAAYAKHDNGRKQPSEVALATALNEILRQQPCCHLVLDALDECTTRQSLLSLLREIKRECTRTHCLVTSRNERDLEEGLSEIADQTLEAHNLSVDRDIQTYIRDRLETMPRLKKWPQNVKIEIESALVRKAGGMFQWVYCQVEVLDRSLQLSGLRRTLTSLPKSLDATYERILRDIDANGYLDSALRILRWVCFATHPLKVSEIIDILATTTTADAIVPSEIGFSTDERILDPDDISLLCSNLVVIQYVHNEKRVNLAHYSIREYLLSDRCQYSSIFDASSSHQHIIETNLIYLQSALTSSVKVSYAGHSDERPFLSYSMRYLQDHMRRCQSELSLSITNRLSKLLLDEAVICAWLKSGLAQICGCSNWYDDYSHVQNPEPGTGRSLFYAVHFGRAEVVKKMIEMGANINHHRPQCSPIKAAAERGYDEIIKILLDHGAVDYLFYGNESAIIAAAENGHKSTVEILLVQNITSGNIEDIMTYSYHIAEWSFNLPADMRRFIMSAVTRRIIGDPTLMLDKSLRDEYILKLLMTDSPAWWHEESVTLLIQAMSTVKFHDDKDKIHCSCLVKSAAAQGSWRGLDLLLRKGGDTYASPEQSGCALIEAARNLRFEIVSQLLHQGVDPNSIAGVDGTVLNAVIRSHKRVLGSISRREFIMQLLRGGANVNARAGAFWLSPQLFWSQDDKHECAGKDPSPYGRFAGTALQLAIQRNDDGLVQLLLNEGAEANNLRDPLGSTLLSALVQGKFNVVRSLAQKDTTFRNDFTLFGTDGHIADCDRFEELSDLILSHNLCVIDALVLATKWNRHGMVKALLSKCQKLQLEDHLMVFDLAAQGSMWKIAETLLEHGLELEQALIWSVEQWSTGSLQWLLEKYAPRLQENRQILTKALKQAITDMNRYHIPLLLEAGADADEKIQGTSAIECATEVVWSTESVPLRDSDALISLLHYSSDERALAKLDEALKAKASFDFTLSAEDGNSSF